MCGSSWGTQQEDAERIFDQEIRNDMKTETELFFQHIVRENRPVLELLNAKYSSSMRLWRISMVCPESRAGTPPGGFREGPVGTGRDPHVQGTFLIVTSQPTRTSPVKRGLFVLDNILGTPHRLLRLMFPNWRKRERR